MPNPGDYVAAGTFIETYRGYDLYIHTAGVFESPWTFNAASMEIRPAFDNTTWIYRTDARRHIDEHIGGTPTPTPQYHNICQNNICTQVSGSGTNECTNIGGSCSGTPTPTPQYHNICQNNICTKVSGSGVNECTNIGGSCGGGGGGGCINCDPSYNYCFSGNCISKKDVLYVGIGLIVLMMATR